MAGRDREFLTTVEFYLYVIVSPLRQWKPSEHEYDDNDDDDNDVDDV